MGQRRDRMDQRMQDQQDSRTKGRIPKAKERVRKAARLAARTERLASKGL
ncbi:MAG: hypothetical protein HN909_00810 [Phycisphaerales bacterium]|jgi:hypothetical protein|nr:hypothetical protein [Phycisphaerales bacterium]MBT7170290.1 hypothetical protein [Phycisphaerales bacterium]